MCNHVTHKGVLLLATGHGYYGRMAYNLAATIKAVEPNMSIAVVYHGSALHHLSEKQREIFDYIVVLPETIQPGFGAKLHLYDLSPFEQTLYLDVDMAWLPRKTPSQLMDGITVDFTSITEGKTGDLHPKYYFWANLEEIQDVYHVIEVYQWRSEVMFWKKSDAVQKMFKRAQAIYASPNLKSVHTFGGVVADELAINIACALAGIQPHKYKWSPSYWPRLHGEGMQLDAAYEQYYALSCGSNVSSSYTKNIYNRVVKAATYKLGV